MKRHLTANDEDRGGLSAPEIFASLEELKKWAESSYGGGRLVSLELDGKGVPPSILPPDVVAMLQVDRARHVMSELVAERMGIRAGLLGEGDHVWNCTTCLRLCKRCSLDEPHTLFIGMAEDTPRPRVANMLRTPQCPMRGSLAHRRMVLLPGTPAFRKGRSVGR